MKKYQGVAITDGKNRKDHILPLRTLLKGYHDSRNTLIPINLGHDRTKPIGYTLLTGLYMEPGKAYITNTSEIMETKEEYEKLRQFLNAYDYEKFCKNHEKELDELKKRLGGVLSNKFSVAPVSQAVAIKDKDIIYRLFPDWIESIKDGLVDLRELESVYIRNNEDSKGVLVPGVYHKEGYLLFAHPFFRRNLSLLNTTNEEFFCCFEKMRDIQSLEIRVAIDMDMIGLIGTEHLELEYQYIRGPYFNDDLSFIPEGVTCYENEYYDNVFSNLVSTQFYWHIQDGKRTFECEEICDRENITCDNKQIQLWGCRYVHSMINPCTGLPTHLDGSIRIYNDEQILRRLESNNDISKYGKESKYIKLWRIDNDFSISIWKELISSFYRENTLIGEYFGGIDKKYDQIKNNKENKSIAKKKNPFEHIEFKEGDGVRIYFRYTNIFAVSKDYDVEIEDLFTSYNGKEIKLLDIDTVTFLKYLKRKGLRLNISSASVIAFEDMIVNFPTFCCNDSSTVDSVILSLKDLCEAWIKMQDDRLISFGIKVNLQDEAGCLSFAGHVNDVFRLLESITKLADMAFEDWLLNIYQKNNSFKLGNDYPDKFSLIYGNRVYFKRLIIPPDKIRVAQVKDGCLSIQLNMSKAEEEEFVRHKIVATPFFKINKDRCSECGCDYNICPCVKFIDENVFDEVVSADFGGCILTNRSAFNTTECK